MSAATMARREWEIINKPWRHYTFNGRIITPMTGAFVRYSPFTCCLGVSYCLYRYFFVVALLMLAAVPVASAGAGVEDAVSP